MKRLLILGGLIGTGVLAYFVAKDYIDAEKFEAVKEKLPKLELEKIKSLVEQKSEIEEKITTLATTISDTARELVEKGSEYAQEKKEKLLNIIEEAKKSIQEEKEKLKEIRERLDSQDSEVV